MGNSRNLQKTERNKQLGVVSSASLQDHCDHCKLSCVSTGDSDRDDHTDTHVKNTIPFTTASKKQVQI